jgi:UDP-N-acetylglucosamine 4,6-dehydratase
MAGVCEALAPGHPVQVIGIRPGERMHEKMLVAEDAAYTTAGLDHFMIQPQQYRGLHLPHGYEYCSDTCRQMQATEFLKLVQES